MKLYTLLFAILTSLCLAAENTQEDLTKQVTLMITELESDKPEDVKKFIQTYARPIELKEELQINDDMIQYFMKSKQGELLEVLKHIKPEKAKKDEDGKSYLYSLDPEKLKSSKKNIKFIYNPETKIFHISN
ncbi:MAG: hypothetical protein ACSHX6_08770 [Akkermansiaceae bacterium]